MLRKTKKTELGKMAFLAIFFFIQSAFPLTNTQNSLIRNTPFPFDTSLTINCICECSDSCAILIQRYFKKIYFLSFSHPAICPVKAHFDFLLPKEPKDSLSHLFIIDINDFCLPADTVHHNTGIQYVVILYSANDSAKLYMQVVSIAGDTFHLRFDTTSFLLKTSTVPRNKIQSNPAYLYNAQGLKCNYYDILGREIPADRIVHKGGSIAGKALFTGNSIYVRFIVDRFQNK